MLSKRMGFISLCIVSGFFCCIRAPTAAAGPIATVREITVEPATLVLNGRRDVRRVLITGKTSSGELIDLSRQATFMAAALNVKVDAAGYFRPVREGRTTVTVTAGGQKTQ